ncbi:hypothetical protein IAU59_000842 [Kwoniella sp. CBS 9459]
MSSSLEEYDAILREAEEQFGNDNVNVSVNVNANDNDDGEHENHTLRPDDTPSTIHTEVRHRMHHPQTGGMMDDEQDDTDFVIMEDDVNHHESTSHHHHSHSPHHLEHPDSHQEGIIPETPFDLDMHAAPHQHEHAHEHEHELGHGSVPGEVDLFPSINSAHELSASAAAAAPDFGHSDLGDDLNDDTRGDRLSASPSGSGSGIGVGAEAEAGAGGGPKSTAWSDKKERQKAQNRKAAEKSRSKKRGAQMALEIKVANMQDENAQLRARLAGLQASKQPTTTQADSSTSIPIATSASSTSPANHAIDAAELPIPIDPTLSTAEAGSTATPAIDAEASATPSTSRATLPIGPVSGGPTKVEGNGIDYAYITKLQTELTNVRTVLLERSVELSRLKPHDEQDQNENQNEDGSEVVVAAADEGEVEGLRKEILSSSGKLTALRAEEDSLKTLIKLLKGEIESLRRQREKVGEILEERKRLDAQREKIGGLSVDGTDVAAAVQAEQGIPGQAVEASHEELRRREESVGGSDQDLPQDQAESSQSAGDTTHRQESHLIQTEHQQPDQGQDNDHLNDPDGDVGLTDDDPVRSGNVDKALLDIRGWIDAAVKDWDQVGSGAGKADDADEMVRQLEEAQQRANLESSSSSGLDQSG